MVSYILDRQLWCFLFYQTKMCTLFQKMQFHVCFIKNVLPSKRVICFILNNLHFPMVANCIGNRRRQHLHAIWIQFEYDLAFKNCMQCSREVSYNTDSYGVFFSTKECALYFNCPTEYFLKFRFLFERTILPVNNGK